MISLDGRNAFNLGSRAVLFEELAAHFPHLLPFARIWYENQTPLVYRSVDGLRFVFSKEGVQQGDPLGPFFFALIVKRVWCNVQAAFPDSAVVISFADNGFALVPNQSIVPDVIAKFKSELAAVGIELNPSESAVYVPNGISAELNAKLDPSFIRCTDGIKVLGAPIGSADFCEAFATARMAKSTKSTYPHLTGLQDPQAASLLLVNCLVPRTDYLLRLVTPDSAKEGALATDSSNFTTYFNINHIENSELTGDETVRQVSLPHRLAGKGVRARVEVSPVAFLAALTASIRLIYDRFASTGAGELPSLLQSTFHNYINGFFNVGNSDSSLLQLDFRYWLTRLDARNPAILTPLGFGKADLLSGAKPPVSFITPPSAKPSISGRARSPDNTQSLQKKMAAKLMDHIHSRLLEKLDDVGKARVLSLSAAGAAAYCTCIPFSPSTSIHPRIYTTLTRLDLGLPQPLLSGILACTNRTFDPVTKQRTGPPCGLPLGPAALHIHMCNRLLGSHHRAVLKALVMVARMSRITRLYSEKETAPLLVPPNGPQHSTAFEADAAFAGVPSGLQTLIVDVKCLSSICATAIEHKRSAEVTLGNASAEEVHWSNAKQYRHLQPSGHDPKLFRPFVVENPYGGFGKLAVATLNDLAACWANATMPNSSPTERSAAIARRSSLYITIISCSFRRSTALDLMNVAKIHDLDGHRGNYIDTGVSLEHDFSTIAATSIQRRGNRARHDT